MNLLPDKRRRLTVWIIGLATACILIFLGVQNLSAIVGAIGWTFGLIAPLILGFVFALILNVPMRFFELKLWWHSEKPILRKIRRPIAFIISLAIILGLLAGIMWLIIPEIVAAVKVISAGVADIIEQLGTDGGGRFSELPFAQSLMSMDWSELLSDLQNWLKNQSGTILNTAIGTLSSFVGGLFDFVVAFVFSIYILFNKEKLKRQSKRLISAWLPQKIGENSVHIGSVLSENFRNFVLGQSTEAIILGVLCLIGMLCLQLPYAPMVSALVGVTALIPLVGGFIGAGVGAFMIMTVSPIKALVFVIFLIILQQLEGNIIYPKVMGNRVNLPPMWILASVTVGGGIAGPIGMLLAVPLTSTAYVLLREATERREQLAKK